ncbi:hypothetical protein [Xenorhabdus bovienii]|uniref:hypothetical protein n=1 Tax=Xenorhabdus bovienii TaxID=40576 RepID=UPI00237CCFF7|nr:hypothetical protein [Xenorhabdus bovienii]
MKNETDTLLSINYKGKQITLIFYSGKPESYTVVLQLTNSGNLETITRSAGVIFSFSLVFV